MSWRAKSWQAMSIPTPPPIREYPTWVGKRVLEVRSGGIVLVWEGGKKSVGELEGLRCRVSRSKGTKTVIIISSKDNFVKFGKQTAPVGRQLRQRSTESGTRRGVAALVV